MKSGSEGVREEKAIERGKEDVKWKGVLCNVSLRPIYGLGSECAMLISQLDHPWHWVALSLTERVEKA